MLPPQKNWRGGNPLFSTEMGTYEYLWFRNTNWLPTNLTLCLLYYFRCSIASLNLLQRCDGMNIPSLNYVKRSFLRGKKTRGRILQKSKSFNWNRTMLFMLVWVSTLYRYCEITADNIEYPEKLVLKLQQQDQILLAVNWSMGLRPRTRTRKEKLKQRIQLPIRRSDKQLYFA